MSVLVTAVDWSGTDWQHEDARPELEFERPYPQINPDRCSMCMKTSERITVTKHRWIGHPLGHLLKRCPDCQEYQDAKVRQAYGEAHQ